MTPRYWRILGAAGACLLLVLGWVVVISPVRSATTELDAATLAQEDQSQLIRSRISLLKKQNEEIPTQQALLAGVQKRIPSTASVPTLIRSITSAADSAKVTLAGITPERAVAVEVAQGLTTAPATSAAADAPAGSGEAAVAEGSTAATTAAVARVQRMPLTITACGSFAELRRYLSGLERMKRVMSVDRLAIARGTCGNSKDDSDLTATITSSVFILPPADFAADGAAGSAGTTTEQAS